MEFGGISLSLFFSRPAKVIGMHWRLSLLFALVVFPCLGDTALINSTNQAATTPSKESAAVDRGQQALQAQRAEQIRMSCIEGRRYIAGRVIQVVKDGLVIDSGYGDLLKPPLNRSWVVQGNVSVVKNPALVEENKPDAICVGPVFLSNIPKRPTVKNYDYVVIHGYPAGSYSYVPVPGVEKTIRQFSASLERAVTTNLAASEK